MFSNENFLQLKKMLHFAWSCFHNGWFGFTRLRMDKICVKEEALIQYESNPKVSSNHFYSGTFSDQSFHCGTAFDK